MIRKAVLIFAMVPLAGCSSLSTLENRVACTADGKEMLYASMYGPIGIASRVDEKDAKLLCAKPEQ